MGLLFLTLISYMTSFSYSAPGVQPIRKNQLLLFFIDGFRYDYVDMQPREDLPGFTKFLKEGVRANYSTPVFPTVSYPGWTSILTGLYPENHGVVGNFIYDAEEKDSFEIFEGDTTGKQKWWTSEPIWITATKAGRRTAVICMSRCDVPFEGVLPEYCEPFEQTYGYDSLLNNAKKAIERLKDGYEFVLLYTIHADNTGHYSGPESEEMKKVVREIDLTILEIQEELEKNQLADNVNIVIVSDHGMMNTPTSDKNLKNLDDYLDPSIVEKMIDYGAHINIKVLPEFVNQAYNGLLEMPGVEVYLKEEIPENLHWKNHKYIYDILVKADIDTFVIHTKSEEKKVPVDSSDSTLIGNHGWDPREEKMRAIFFAKGPDFKKGQVIDPIENIDIYGLLAYVLQIEPLPNNGTLSAVYPALDLPYELSYLYGIEKENALIASYLLVLFTTSIISWKLML